MKRFARWSVAGALHFSGINAAYKYLAINQRAVVLMYHRVIDEAEAKRTYIQPGMYVTVKTFEIQMKYLSQHYHVVPLEELVETIAALKPIQPNTCAVTFDDGWRDTYLHAFPILKRYNLPATIFLVSGYVGTDRWFWPERILNLLARFFGTMIRVDRERRISPDLDRIGLFDLASDHSLTPQQKIEKVIETMKGFRQDEIQKIVREIESLLRQPCDQEPVERLMLNWGEVKEMARFNITFGSHTKNHMILTGLAEEEAREEIAESRREIQRRLSKPCTLFCYPNGDYNDQIVNIVKENYVGAVSTEEGLVCPGDDIGRLKRLGIHNDISFTRALFECRISGIFGIIGRRASS